MGNSRDGRSAEEALAQAAREAQVPEVTPEKTSDRVGQRPGGEEHNQGQATRG
jgi:hypothetical protein